MVEQIALKHWLAFNKTNLTTHLVVYLQQVDALCRHLPSFAPGVSVKVGCLQKKLGLAHVSLQLTVPVITQITKYALDEVRYLIEAGQMRAAQDNFFGTYNVMVAKAQLKGRQQEFYTPPTTRTQRTKHVPVSNDEAQKHLKSLMERLKINGRKPAPVQKLEAKEKEPELIKELGPDPFDNPHEYAEMCRREGMPIPRNILQLIDGANV